MLDKFSEKPLKSNIVTTEKLLELANKYNIQRFVFVSSCAVCGDAQ